MLQCLASIHRNKRWEVLKGNSSKRSHPGLCTCYSAGCFQSKLRSENSTHILNQFGKQAVILLQYITIFTHSYNNHLKNGYFQSHLKKKNKKKVNETSVKSLSPAATVEFPTSQKWLIFLTFSKNQTKKALWLIMTQHLEKMIGHEWERKKLLYWQIEKKLFLERKKFGEIKSKIMRRRN